MAAKLRPGRVENDIEKYRGEANWSRVLDLSRQLSQKTANHETLVKFLQLECQVERSLLDKPPTDDNVDEVKDQLKPSVVSLHELLATNPQANMKQEILLLLGKIHYAMGEYETALDKFNDLQLDTISVGEASSRKLKLIGEAFAIKGLCLEKMPPISSSRFRQAEREQKIIECFERSGDISLVQLQERLEKGPNKLATASGVTAASGSTASNTGAIWAATVDTDTVGVGPIVETAIQRSPILYIRNGELNKCIGRFRELLRAVETRAIQGLRQTLARQLAEVLLRGVCLNSYVPIDLTEPRDDKSQPPLKPKKYCGDGLFVPKNAMEEILLLLLISESIATREAVLNRSPDLTDARLHTFHNTTAVYDLLTMALVKRAQFTMLSETFERAMRFSFDEFHIWYQFALSLICSEKYSRAYVVLKECMRLDPSNPIVYLQATKLAYEFLGLTDEGVEFCERLVELGESTCPYRARAYLMLGIGYSLKADEVLLQAQRQTFQRKAVDAFNNAVELDPNDYLAHFHLALQMALRRQISEAIKHVRQAIQLHSDHHNSHHLLALLLSAQKQYNEALIVVEAALGEYPQSFRMLFTKCKLLTRVSTHEAALQTCRHMLQLWKDLYESSLDSESRGTGLLERITTDHRSLLHLQLEVSDRDSGSVRVESVAASKLEHALSEVVSSVASGFQTKSGRQQTWTLQMQIWLLLAELYLNMDRLESANACIQEASVLFPVSHVVSHMRGRYHQAKRELLEAKKCYENAIAINPSHNKSLHQLGVVQHMLGNSRLAEKVLRDAITYDPTASQCWQSLGKVLDSLGDHEVATECLITAVELEATSPVVPFSTIPKVLI